MIKPSILITSATEDEAAPLLLHLKDKKNFTIGHRRLIAGYLHSKFVYILITGPGIINTTQALTCAVEKLKLSLVLQIGCAGVFPQTCLNIGDVCIALNEIDVHSGIEPKRKNEKIIDLPFALIKKLEFEIKNIYPFDQKLVNLVYKACINKNIKVLKGDFITVSTITATDERAIEFYKHYRPCMEAMEGVALAHVCLLYDIPFIEIRAASNFVGKRDLENWNFPLAFERSCIAALAYLNSF